MPCWRAALAYGEWGLPFRSGTEDWEDTLGMYETDDIPDKNSPDIYQVLIGRQKEFASLAPSKTE